MAHHTPVTVDPKQLEHAQMLWKNFTNVLVWASSIIAITLIVLAFFFTG
ncbi:MAG: hypothetical protein IT558_04485 [Alphaproteobacteria bacterium]|nr:hypothetical protein [Alphaproteobacteria bacterium]